MTLTEEQWEDLKLALDRLQNFTAGLVNMTTLPDRIHVQSLRHGLPEVVSDFMAVVGAVDPDYADQVSP
jgi:hypothetical protein